MYQFEFCAPNCVGESWREVIPGVTDLLDGKGTQRGYFNNVHPDGGRDFGTFEGRVTTTGDGITVEGTFTFAGGDSEYRGITGGGTFKTGDGGRGHLAGELRISEGSVGLRTRLQRPCYW